jgi:hypothetical protein
VTRTILAKEKVMLVSKSVRHSAIIAVLSIGVAGCSDSLTAPVAISPEPAEPLFAKGGSGKNGKVSSRTFTIRPGRAVKENFGEHHLTMPPNAICDPATSGYGVSYWNLPCNPVDREIEVTAYWTEYKGDPVIRFKPDLRFVPAGDDQSRWVVLSVKHTKGIDPDKYYTLLWRDPATNEWIDESVEDASQKTDAKKNLRRVSRRLKHFSDYYLWFGFGSYNVTSGMGDFLGLGGW